MNVRDLSQYIKKLCGQETLHLLGTNKELLLHKIYGEDPSADQVKSVISDAASFASNAEEQLFYEFVQNAYDASADSLFFYANEKYLIVLNNGEPFYTDFDLFDTSTPIRDGQLYNFLAKGKSLKRNDNKKLGKYGQGSKLLYTLLTEVSESEENEELLIKTLYDEKKGPYLISWYDSRQLANLLLKQGKWTPAQGDDYKENILFAKILMSYYPIAPGTSEELFSTEEALGAIDAFDTLVDPRRNLHFLNRGTALIIPLGEGKYEKITSEINLERVKTRLGGFASITKDQEINEGKTVDHIYVMGEEVEQHEVQSVFVEFKVEGKPFHYHFAFNPIFAEKNFVNLFKGLPILETKLRLGFIIDSQKFDVDSSRQRISDKDKTKGQLIRAFSELVTVLKDLKESNPAKFDFIYKSIAATKYLEGEDFKFIKEAFQEVFVPFFEEFVLTSTGEYEKKENVRYFLEEFKIPLKEIGISKYKWIDQDIKKDLHRHKVDVEPINFSTLLSDADTTKLSAWIKSLSSNDYKDFSKLCDSHKTETGVIDNKLFRSNKGNLYSYNELIGTTHIYYPFEEGMKFGECEHINEILTKIEITNYRQQLFDKIKNNIDSFRISDSTKDDATNLLAWIEKDNSAYYTQRIRHEIYLLQNWHDEYVSFENLLIERPEDTIFFDNYIAKGHIPEAVKANNWLVCPRKAKKSCWQWIVRNWENLQDKEEWGVNTHKYISDIKSVYKTIPADSNGNVDTTKLTLYLDEDGKPTKSIHAIVNNISKLTEEEYNYLGEKVTHLRLLPYEYHKDLMEAPFQVETIQSIHIVNDGLNADEKLLRIFIKITDMYLTFYRTQEIGGLYRITRTTSGYNYIDSVSSDLESELLSSNFYRIPNKVQEILQTESGKYKFSSNENMLNKAIERISSPIKLLPFVKKANANVVSNFFKNLKEIIIDKQITKEDLKWQLLEFAVRESDDSDENDYIETVFKLIRHHSDELPSSITQRFVNIGENEYDVYLLDERYKNDNQVIDSFLKCLPSQNEIEYFKEHYYQGKEDEVSTEVLYDELKTSYLTIEQLRFCLDYAITEEDDCDDLEIEETESLSKALDMILSNNFKGFDKHFKIEDMDLNCQAYAKHELLLEEEFLPKELHEWLDKNPSGLELFSQLITVSNPYINARQALLDNVTFSDYYYFADELNSDIVDRTIDWAINKNLTYDYASERFYTMMAIIEKLPAEYEIMPFLRYTGKLVPVIDNFESPKPTFKLERYQDGGVFLSYYSWEGDRFQNRLRNSPKLSNFIKDNIVYVYGDKELLLNHGYKKQPRWSVQTFVDIQNFPEHDDPVYRIWKQMKESNGITIHTSAEPIAMNFNIMASNSSVFADKMKDSELGYEPGKRVVVQQPNKEGLTIMKTIAKHISNMEFFKEPFIALQALYVDQWELLQQGDNGTGEGNGKSTIDLTNSSLNEEQAQEALNKISAETADNIEQVNNITKQLNGEELEKLNDIAEPIKELMDGLEKEDVERLAENKNKLMQMLDDLEEAEEEEKESQVRQTIGFIGELIYGHYLEHKKLKRDQDFVHAALEGIGDYDFEIKSEQLFVDVKTTLYSLKDGTAPFYLHRSQNLFMQKHPDAKYHIVRISLIDLNLKKSYEEIRDTYGKDANPIENPNLRKRCEEIAKRYWRGAKIEEFDALSPEYAIRIEQKLNK